VNTEFKTRLQNFKAHKELKLPNIDRIDDDEVEDLGISRNLMIHDKNLCSVDPFAKDQVFFPAPIDDIEAIVDKNYGTKKTFVVTKMGTQALTNYTRGVIKQSMFDMAGNDLENSSTDDFISAEIGKYAIGQRGVRARPHWAGVINEGFKLMNIMQHLKEPNFKINNLDQRKDHANGTNAEDKIRGSVRNETALYNPSFNFNAFKRARSIHPSANQMTKKPTVSQKPFTEPEYHSVKNNPIIASSLSLGKGEFRSKIPGNMFFQCPNWQRAMTKVYSQRGENAKLGFGKTFINGQLVNQRSPEFEQNTPNSDDWTHFDNCLLQNHQKVNLGTIFNVGSEKKISPQSRFCRSSSVGPQHEMKREENLIIGQDG
jgi:hypothetical protein